MTREEFRDKKSKDYRKYRESYGIKDPVYLDEIEDAYYQGMVNADAHPHWISVEEELPICNIPYIDWTNEPVNDLMESKQVIVLTNEGSMHIATLNQNYDVETNEPKGEPYWFDEIKTEEGDWINKKVTHWIYLSLPNKK